MGSNESVTVIQPAMGIRASYYKRLARCFAEELEIDVILADYRGMGNSSVRANRTNKIGYSALVNDTLELINQ